MLTAIRHPWMLLFAFALLLAGASSGLERAAQPVQSKSVLLLAIRDAIGPATSDFFVRALDRAQERKARLLIVQLDTPGGLDSSMRDMIKAMLASPVPVAVGFGVSRPAHVRAIARAGADGVIVASALVDALGPDGRDVASLERLVRELRAATTTAVNRGG